MCKPVAPRASDLLIQDAYVWQRAWTDPVRDAVATHGTNFGELIPLVAEVTWRGSRMAVAKVAVDYELLRSTNSRVGLALRVGALPQAPPSDFANELARLAADLLSEAKTNQVHVREFQVDFDCAESKLDGYCGWIRTVRGKIAPVPLTITALPSWLKRPAFKRLVDETDGLVLQVHSLERPKSAAEPFTLCDAKKARAAIELAARYGKPFRVALPTYGYTFAFDGNGRFAGLSAEGPARSWPATFSLREVRADEMQMATMVAELNQERPRALTGIIWYRLPVEGDRLNWSWPTLQSVMAGKAPEARVEVALRRPEQGLLELDLLNKGAGEHRAGLAISVQWNTGRLIASDGLEGFEPGDEGSNRLTFSRKNGARSLGPGERQSVGWMRFDREAEVHVALEKN